MAYFSPYINETGIHIPTYTDIRDELVNQAKAIFGQDIYLGNDSQDYQFISAFASMLYDSYLTCQSVYNSRGPATAIGTGLDVVVGINGIGRLGEQYSTATVLLNGTANTSINNGIVSDIAGNQWTLPASVIISTNGTVTTTATCTVPGPIQAPAGTITGIVTPTLGWTSVTNTADAIIGRYVETDPELRARQAVSTANPSRTVLEGIRGAIASITGVTRYAVYENDTNSTNALGHPAHSVTAVVEGGADQDVANLIAIRKTPGAYTNGTTSVSVTDIYDVTSTINFYRPTYVDIVVVVNVKQLAGYNSQITSDIASYIADYINSLDIGSTLTLSSLWGAALQANKVPTSPYFSITGLTAARSGSAQATNDINFLFYEAASGDPMNVTINVT